MNDTKTKREREIEMKTRDDEVLALQSLMQEIRGFREDLRSWVMVWGRRHKIYFPNTEPLQDSDSD